MRYIFPLILFLILIACQRKQKESSGFESNSGKMLSWIPFQSLLLIFFICFTNISQAQRFTISGYVRDSANAENLIGAVIYEKNLLIGTTTNNYGFYSLTLKADSVTIVVSFDGYAFKEFSFVLKKDTIIHAELIGGIMQEIVIGEESSNPVHDRALISSIILPMDQLKAMPALLCEVDVLKVMQLLPGVHSGMEGSSGIYVRGGGPDQNLILLDGIPVYNASHLFGFFSIFNAGAINNLELMKGGFPARYGGRLSSVIDISMKEGNMKEAHVEGSVGLIASRFTLEGPIVKDKSSFIVSGRRTNFDLLILPLNWALGENEMMNYYFNDLNVKLNHRFSEKDRVYLSIYRGGDNYYTNYKINEQYGADIFKSKGKNGISWGNITTALRWNHMLNPKMFGNATFSFSRYDLNTILEEKAENIVDGIQDNRYSHLKYHSGIQDYTLKVDFDYVPNPKNHIRFGTHAIRHAFNPGAYGYKGTEQEDITFGEQQMNAREFGLYVEDVISIHRRLKLNTGLHLSGFHVDGRLYHSLQPRIAGSYLIAPAFSYKISYSQMQQYIHLLTNSGIGLPTDLWVPSTGAIQPQQSEQYAMGFSKSLKPMYEISLEGYFKRMKNLIEYKEGANFMIVERDWQQKVESGKGVSYGAEFLLQKKLGSFTGWIGYTLSWSNRTFENLNDGKSFPYKYDRRHDISLALVKMLRKNVEFSSNWVYGSGNAISLPVAKYLGENSTIIYDYGPRNSFRMHPYHRLDLRFSFIKSTGKVEKRWVVGLYNAYNRQNPFYVDWKIRSRRDYYAFEQHALLPIIPSVSYSFKF